MLGIKGYYHQQSGGLCKTLLLYVNHLYIVKTEGGQGQIPQGRVVTIYRDILLTASELWFRPVVC